ncbi:F-box protein At5g07610-like [Cornus florida]|uniref:F-box protein At5g07610-like n=1 Tax=Cornus florida TaxID=4283 RepID=UPI0028A04E9C|nr:F-box protein At5g07610-like [Cornus florida]
MKEYSVFYDYTLYIDVYSLETRSWRSLGKPFEIKTSDYSGLANGVFCNGSIHWINISGLSFRFDVDHEYLERLPMIPVSGNIRERKNRYFGESNGHLFLIENYQTVRTQFDVFEIERDYSKWFVKYRVDLVGIVNAFPEMDAYSILNLVREEDEDESSLLLHVPEILMAASGIMSCHNGSFINDIRRNANWYVQITSLDALFNVGAGNCGDGGDGAIGGDGQDAGGVDFDCATNGFAMAMAMKTDMDIELF